MLRHGKRLVALGLAIPAGHAGKAVCNVLNLNIHRRWIEEVQPPSR
jgi:hypothetical protein